MLNTGAQYHNRFNLVNKIRNKFLGWISSYHASCMDTARTTDFSLLTWRYTYCFGKVHMLRNCVGGTVLAGTALWLVMGVDMRTVACISAVQLLWLCFRYLALIDMANCVSCAMELRRARKERERNNIHSLRQKAGIYN